MAILVKDSKERYAEITVNADRLDTVSCVKEHINRLEPGMLRFCRPLSLNGCNLEAKEDTRTLNEYGIESEAVLELLSEYIDFTVSHYGAIYHCRAKISATCKSLYDSVSKHTGLHQRSFRINFDGLRIGTASKLSDYDIRDGDCLELFQEPCGKYWTSDSANLLCSRNDNNAGGGGSVLCTSILLHHQEQIVATLHLQPYKMYSVDDVKTEIHQLSFQDMNIYYNNKLLESQDDKLSFYYSESYDSIAFQLRGL